MKPVTKFAATVAMAFSIGMLPQANAQIMHKANGVGDALLFPVFWGQPGVDNYFTISNSSGAWVQAHIRFRNGTWCGELLDFDVIFSPGDVLIFRVADVDGDGYWEIDQSLDPHTFEYTGKLGNCGPDTDKGPNNTPSVPALPGQDTQQCMNQNDILVPNPGSSALLTDSLIDHARSFGLIEVFAEGILDGMTHAIMARLTDPAFTGKRANEGQRQFGNGLGTSIWSWVNAENGFGVSRTASDAGNWLSGSAFITIAGSGMGIAYNADVFKNFRTSGNPHRIDNYSPDSAVILHNDNSIGRSSPSPFGDYQYEYGPQETRDDELRISFNNTWGPTLSDGDDYRLTTWQTEPGGLQPDNDNWDNQWNVANSVAEVDDAIRAGGQSYTSFYFDGELYNKSNLGSLYFAVLPTKFFSGEDDQLYGLRPVNAGDYNKYIVRAVNQLLTIGKPLFHSIWDHEENSPSMPTENCTQSPCIGNPPMEQITLGQCVSVFPIDFIKQFNKGSENYSKGRVVIGCDSTRGACNPMNNAFGAANAFPTWSLLGYTFELDDSGIGQWRSMQQY